MPQTWKKTKEDSQNAPFFWRKNMHFTLDTTSQPKMQMVKGKYGDREMYVLQTDIGRLQIDAVQFNVLYNFIEPYIEQHLKIEIFVTEGQIEKVVPK